MLLLLLTLALTEPLLLVLSSALLLAALMLQSHRAGATFTNFNSSICSTSGTNIASEVYASISATRGAAASAD
jgi:hypothetical protein